MHGGPAPTPEARAALEHVARRRGIRLLLAFGSQVTGRTHPASDRDLAVLVDPAERGDWPDLSSVWRGWMARHSSPTAPNS